MEDFKQVSKYIRSRRSVYPNQYIKKEIESELIMEMLENANHAPTHRLTQPWRFKVVTGEAKSRIGEFLSSKYKEITDPKKFMPSKVEKTIAKCEQSDKILLICFQRDPEQCVPRWEEIAATSMAVQNIYLSCSAAGIGCYWSTPKTIEYMSEFHPMADGEECIGLFYMGYFEEGKDIPKSPRNPILEKVDWLE